jgi:2-keto-myo-inositol isomerase
MSKRGEFEYCLNTSTIHECGLDVAQEIEVAAQAGYQGIELWVSEITTYLEQGGTPAQLRRLLVQNQIEVPNLIAFFHWAHPDDRARRDALEEARQVFQLARELDCPYVAAPPSGISDRDDVPLDHVARCYGELLEAGRQTGVRPLLEFWGHSRTLGSLDEAMAVLEQVDDPDAAILADVFHMAKGSSRFELLRELDGGQLRLFHLNDYPGAADVSRLTDRERVYPGDGVAPYDVIVPALHEIGYTGVLSLELFNEGYQRAGALPVATEGLENMKQTVEANV